MFGDKHLKFTSHECCMLSGAHIMVELKEGPQS